VGRCTGGQTLHSLPFLSSFPSIAISVGDHDAGVWHACKRARFVERDNVAPVYAFAGVPRCASTEHVVRSVAICKTGCLNTLTSPRGAFACLSPSGRHSDVSPGLWRSLWPY